MTAKNVWIVTSLTCIDNADGDYDDVQVEGVFLNEISAIEKQINLYEELVFYIMGAKEAREHYVDELERDEINYRRDQYLRLNFLSKIAEEYDPFTVYEVHQSRIEPEGRPENWSPKTP